MMHDFSSVRDYIKIEYWNKMEEGYLYIFKIVIIQLAIRFYENPPGLAHPKNFCLAL